MRLDDPRLAELARGDGRALGGHLVRRGVGRPPAVHRGRPVRGRRAPARPPQALPADLRAVRRAAVLRRGRQPAGGPVAARGRDRDRDLRGLLAPVAAPTAGARRRADPDQRLVVAGSRPGRHQRGRARDGDLVADADADLRPADDVVRRLLQPGRGRRVDLVLGRLRGDRPVRSASVQCPAVRRGPVHGRRRRSRTFAASGSPCRCCATSAPSSTFASCPGSSRSGPAWPTIRPPSPTPGRASTRPHRIGRCRGPSGSPTWARGRGDRPAVRAARRARDRHGRGPPGDRRVHPGPAPPGRLRADGRRHCRAGSIRRWSRTSSPRRSEPSGCMPS